MEDINNKLLEVKTKLKEKERLTKTLQHAYDEKSILKGKKNQLSELLKKEKSHVEKLENMSISNFIYTISGRKLEKLEKEKRDVLALKLKFDTVKEELYDLDLDITRLECKIRDLGDLDTEYRGLLIEKESLLKSKRPTIAKRLDDIVEEESNLLDRDKEIKEAIEAGYQLLNALERADRSLSSAKDWGTWDILGGGMISTMAKHSKIDDAQEEISNIQSLSRTFYRELEDIDSYEKITLEIGSFLTFADYFFDGLLADLSVQSKLKDSSRQVRDAQNKVSRILSRLNYDLQNTSNKIDAINIERLKLIETA